MSKEIEIRTPIDTVNETATPIVKNLNSVASNANKSIKKRYFRSKKRLIRNGFVVVNMAVILSVGVFVLGSRTGSTSTGTPVLSASAKDIADPLDILSSADIAVNIAQLTRLDEITAVTNNADTINSKLDIVPADSQIVAKPQIITTDIKTANDIVTYVSVDGDTVTSLAEKFGVSKETIRWSNDLAGDNIAVGVELTIPPIDGLIYEVKSGDTVKKLAEKYSSDEAKITAFNDTEITGLVVGQKIVIPDGSVPVTVARSVPNYLGFRHGGSNPIYGYNGYDYGYCTWYTANRRAEVGKPIPANLGNASTWKVLSQRAGIPVGNTPQKYAVIWTPPRDYYGHVGFVEEVYPDGSVRVSEMNVRGWNVRSEKVLTPEQAAGYSYVY